MDRAYRQGVQAALVKYALSAEHLDLAGLAALGIPVGHHLTRSHDEPADPRIERAMAGIELGGLGLLATPSILKLLGRH